MLKNLKLPAAVCGAALLAGAVAATPAEAATVGGAVAINAQGEPDYNRCQMQLSDAELAFLDSFTFIQDSQYLDTALLKAFEATFPDAKRVGDSTRKVLQNDAFRATVFDDFEGFVAPLTNRLVELGIDRAAADWYVREVADELLTETNTGKDQQKFIADVTAARDGGYIDAPRPTDVYELGERIPTGVELVNSLRAEYPDMDRAQLTQWANTFDQSPEADNARKAQRFEEAFVNARELCAKGGNGTVAFPTESQVDTYSGPSNAEGGTLDDGAPSSEPRTEVDAASQTKKSSGGELGTGAIVGIVLAVLAALGVAGAAFALLNS